MADLAHEGNYLVSWVPTIANKAAPTVSELNAGVDLDPRMTPTGLGREWSTDRKDTTKLNSTFGTQSSGRRSVALTIQYVREVGDTAGLEVALVYKALGYFVVRDSVASSTAWAAAQEVEVYPAQLDQPSKTPPAVNEDQMINIGVAMTAEPALDAVVAT